jgi:hypothetical protein
MLNARTRWRRLNTNGKFMKRKIVRTMLSLTIMNMIVVLNLQGQTFKPGPPPIQPTQPVAVIPTPIQPGQTILPGQPNQFQPVQIQPIQPNQPYPGQIQPERPNVLQPGTINPKSAAAIH